MRTVVLTALGLLMSAPSIPAQDQPVGWAAKLFKDETGKIPSGHNFGTVPKGAMLQHQFPIKNIYAVPLTITCDVSCSCTTVTPKRPATLVLQPHETGTIDITMDTTRFSGPKQVDVYVYVQHPQYWSSATLVIQAQRREDVELAPAQAVFGVVAQGQQVTRELMVRYRGNQPRWEITGTAPDQTAPLDVRYVEAYRQGGQVGYKVSLTLKPIAPPGSNKGDLILTTNDPNGPVTVPYDMMVQAPLSVSQEVARLGTIKVGAPTQRSIIVKGNQPFRILSVDGQGEGVTAVYRPDAVMANVLTVKVEAAAPGPVQKTLTIHTDLNGGATTAVKVEATAVAP